MDTGDDRPKNESDLSDKEIEFLDKAKEAADFFKGFDKNKTIRVISHLDADGISAASILIKMLNRTNRRYSISIVQQLSEEKIKSLAKERYSSFIFTDIGSGQLKEISNLLKGRKVLVMDHHQPKEGFEKWRIGENILQYNPHLSGIDGNDNISGSGVVYFFSKAVLEKNKDMAHIAIVGALGDMQEDYGFKPLNNIILKYGIEEKKIKVINGIRIFGAQTRALHRLLQYSTDPYIPGVTGSESGAIDFLKRIGINPKGENGWRRLIDLNDEEIKRLVAGMIMLRINDKVEDAQRIVGPVYLMEEEEKASPLKDCKEFATLLNACGRLDMASLGIGACLGDEKSKKRALDALKIYRKEIVESLRWFENNQNNDRLIKKGKGYIIINSKEDIRSSMIGTLCSILTNSVDKSEVKFILGLSRNDYDDSTKISMRTTLNDGVDLREILQTICSKTEAEVGGHKHAAGALIKSNDEKEIIERAEGILERMALEEKVELE